MEDSSTQIILTVVIATVLFLMMIAVVGMLLVLNSNRRQKYQLEVAEMAMKHQQEVMQAEREATEMTLSAVGRELHDNVGQLLTVAQMGMLHPDIPDTPAVNNSMEALEQSIEAVRGLGRSLNSDTWQNKTLYDALEDEGKRLERTGRAKVEVDLDKNAPDLKPDEKTILFRCCQEVLSNALRHSKANTISIKLVGSPKYSLTIADDGQGFDPDVSGNGSGLLNIKRRCAMIGFDAQLETAVDQGCRWTFVTSDSNPSAG